jgi:hypothetical protein
MTQNSTRLQTPKYNPNEIGRRCAGCGQIGGWLRLDLDRTPGGWLCPCQGLPEPAGHATMRHQCGAACVLGVA